MEELVKICIFGSQTSPSKVNYTMGCKTINYKEQQALWL